jgi:hypothetical protein
MTVETLGAMLLVILARLPAWFWWLLAVIVVHGWAIGLLDRSYEGYDAATNTLKRNSKRDFPRLCLWVHGLLSGFCAFVLAPAYGPGWLLGAGYFAFIVWRHRHEPRLYREERFSRPD